MRPRSIKLRMTDLNVEKLATKEEEFRVSDSIVTGLYLRVSQKALRRGTGVEGFVDVNPDLGHSSQLVWDVTHSIRSRMLANGPEE
jgi:hypothetical protein